MGRGNKFANLHRYFSQLEEDEITIKFKEIESIIGEELCDSAYNYKPYWYDSETHMLPKCWVENGYKMTNLDLKNQEVSFSFKETKQKIQEIADKINNMAPKSNKINYIRKEPLVSIDKIVDAINKFYSDLEADENARYLSWEHCYKVFKDANRKETLTDEDTDYLSLHLAFYLASWGMLRGSSFLLQKDYRVHIDIIKELLKPCYNNLWSINYIELQKQENLDALSDLTDNIKTIYRIKRRNIKEVGTDISDILITKVLLGTMGCVPAYDEYFKRGLSKYNIATQQLGKSSINGLAEYYKENETELEEVRLKISKARQLEYPQMKILDMAFWQLGFDYK